ncbi:hypothetical protein AAE478_005789 [Parahypoxylon ruwenzoriense]
MHNRTSDGPGALMTANADIPRERNNDRIVLRVGERQFTTLRDTLVGESDYFAARLSNRWNDDDEDGTYFIDADPTLFEHILNYLRNGNYPLFFDSNTQAFDYAKYMGLLGEALYFGIHKLEEWIEKKKYLGAVKIQRNITVFEDTSNEELRQYLLAKSSADTRIDLSTSWGTKKVYVCPRDIYVHHGDPSRCGRACERVSEAEGGRKYNDAPALRAVICTAQVLFNPAACMDSEEKDEEAWL